jgi:hypothetical protein
VNANFSTTATAVNSKQNLVTGACPAGQSIRTVNADGSVICQLISSFGGDGSAGDLIVAAAVNWNTTPPANPNFANITINAAQTLTVPAGTTIRCSGNFSNLGTLNVSVGAQKIAVGFFTAADVSSKGTVIGVAHPGDAFGAAGSPDWHDNFTAAPVTMNGGFGGVGIPQATAITSSNSFRIGGGAGSGHSSGSDGGGLVKILCRGTITNSGTINANGAAGAQAAGGGGGGIVILASETSTVNAAGGTIVATGGAGGAGGGGWGGRGGGGGGGIVVLVAPTITAAGTITVGGGAAGIGGTDPATTNVRISGGGGGASGGAGGAGGGIASNGVLGVAAGGGVGYTLSIPVVPSTLIP